MKQNLFAIVDNRGNVTFFQDVDETDESTFYEQEDSDYLPFEDEGEENYPQNIPDMVDSEVRVRQIPRWFARVIMYYPKFVQACGEESVVSGKTGKRKRSRNGDEK